MFTIIEGVLDDNGAEDSLKVTHFVETNDGSNRARYSVTLEVMSRPFQPIQNRRIGSQFRGQPIFWYDYCGNRSMLEGQKYACINIKMPSSIYGVSISGHKEYGTIRAQSLATVICGLLRGF
jgi:hypothetical protein